MKQGLAVLVLVGLVGLVSALPAGARARNGRIAYETTPCEGSQCENPRADTTRVLTYFPDGSGRRVIPCAAPCQDTEPSSSPDGRRLALVRSSGLTIVDADGSHPRAVPLSGRKSVGPVAWSPDGRRLAFANGRLDGHYDIYTVRLDGSGL